VQLGREQDDPSAGATLATAEWRIELALQLRRSARVGNRWPRLYHQLTVDSAKQRSMRRKTLKNVRFTPTVASRPTSAAWRYGNTALRLSQ
jgi:hypothetical protein